MWHQGPKAGHSGWWVQLQGQVSGAGGGFGGGYTETGLFSPGPQHPQSPLGPPGHFKKWVSFSTSQSRGVWGPPKPDGVFVCLGSQSGEPIMFPWEAGKVVLACVTRKLRRRGVYSKLPSQPLGLHVWGPLFLFPVPCNHITLTLLSVCSLILVEVVERAEPCGW